jgi:predicted MFS family arabinose efflux permease
MNRLSLQATPADVRHSLVLVLSIFLPFAAGYYLSFLYRTITAVIAPNLAADVELSASELGLLSSVYFLSFAALQLPLGVLLDRFGPRRVNAGLLLIAAGGALLFGLAQGMHGLVAGRALIGVGVSACMMASFKAFALWFSPQRLPAINGYLLTFGALGAISATAPTEWLLGITDWRGLFIGLAVGTAIVSAAIFVLVPEHREAPVHSGLREQLAGLAQVLRDRLFWQVAPVTGLSLGASLTVVGLWGGPWLRDVMGFDRDGVATHLLIAASGMGVGYLTIGTLAERLSRLGIKLQWMSAAGMGGFLLAMIALASGRVEHVGILLAAFGFLATSATLNFALMSQHFGRQLAGRANTALNLTVFVAAFVLQWGAGAIIGRWPAGAGAGYAPDGYQFAFGTLVLLQALGLSWMLALRGSGRSGR